MSLIQCCCSTGPTPCGLTITATVTACGSSAYVPAGTTVTISTTGFTASTTVGPSPGNVASFTGLGAGTYTVTVAGSTGLNSGTATCTITCASGGFGAVNCSTTINLTAASGYSCTSDGCCPQSGNPPFSDITSFGSTLTLNDGVSAVTLNYTATLPFAGVAGYSATATRTAPHAYPYSEHSSDTDIGSQSVPVYFEFWCNGSVNNWTLKVYTFGCLVVPDTSPILVSPNTTGGSCDRAPATSGNTASIQTSGCGYPIFGGITAAATGCPPSFSWSATGTGQMVAYGTGNLSTNLYGATTNGFTVVS